MKVDDDATLKDETDLTLYNDTPEPERRPNIAPPSFEGRLNLSAYAFQQPSNPLRRKRPALKVDESSFDVVKKEKNSPTKVSKGCRNRPRVLTTMPEPDDAHVTVTREVKVEKKVEVVREPAYESDQVATPNKVENGKANSPLLAPIQSAERYLPINNVSMKQEPEEEATVFEQVAKNKVRHKERVVTELDGSSPGHEVNVKSAAPTASTNAPFRAATASSQAAVLSAAAIPGNSAATAPHKPLIMQNLMDDFVAEMAAENSTGLSSSSDIASRSQRRLVSARRELSDLMSGGDDEGDFRDESTPLAPTKPAPSRPGPSVVPVTCSPFFTASSSTAAALSSKRSSNSTSSGSPAKKARAPSSYKPPETYAHLQELVDLMAPNLLGIFVGVNPGLKSAAVGHAYAGPSNRFWKLLHTAGITERRLPPEEDTTLPEKYQFGNTNIVGRPTRSQMELSKDEMVDSVQTLIDKVRKWKPESVVIVGKKIWEIIFSVRHGRGIQKHEFNYGWQADSERMGAPKIWEKKETTVDGKPWEGARVFVATSTSGAAATPPAPEKERIWRELGKWVNKRREERGLTHYPPGPTYKKNS